VEAGGGNRDSSKALMRKIVEHLMLSLELKTGCRSHLWFRSYGGKTLPGSPKQVEGAQIAQNEQNCRAHHVTFSTENRMSVALPVPELWRKNTSGFAETGGRSRDNSQVHEANL
jgi:hypothetical protein